MDHSILHYKDNIIKLSKHCVIFSDDDHVYKQYPFKLYKWVNELAIVKFLTHENIIKFKRCSIIYDNVVDIETKEILLNQKEKHIRFTMDRYDYTLDQVDDFRDAEIFYIMDKLIGALLHCHENNVLHRDIKEQNIFLNYAYVSDGALTKRHITELVLADFNISKYKHQHVTKSSRVMTISHRPPELWDAIHNNTRANYNEKIDVWGFCIVLTYLITGQSFHSFMRESFLKLDKNIPHDAHKVQLVLRHFLKIYSRPLFHRDFFEEIIFMGITDSRNRYTMQEIYKRFHTYINIYAKKYKDIYAQIPSPPLIVSPEYLPVEDILETTLFIRELHDILQNNHIILSTFYKNLHCIPETLHTKNIMFGLYILIANICNDTYKPISYYTNAANYTSDKDFIAQHKLKQRIHIAIANLLYASDYNILCSC